jgi:hypothetical protein
MKIYPLLILFPYLVMSYLLFLFSPMDWEIENIYIVNIYIAFMLTIIYISFLSGSSQYVNSSRKLNFGFYVLFGSLAAILLITPTTILYSGKYPWQFMSLWADQQLAYTTYQERLAQSTSLDRAPIAFFRVLAHPFVFSVIPLCFLNWSSLRFFHKALLALTVVCALINSLARGTDRETADIVIFLLACLLVYQGRKSVSRNEFQHSIRSSNWRVSAFAMTVLAALAVLVFTVFVERKLGRYSGNVAALCMGSSADYCLSKQSALWELVGDWGTFAVGITSSYMSQGFFGLSLAMKLDFQSTLGTGISPLVARAYEALSGDTDMYTRSYTYRLREFGWSDENAWSTLMTWFANDLGFVGAFIPLAVLSYMFGAAWRDAVLARDDRAAIVFVLLFLMFIYLPANNQIGQSPDLSYAFLFWLVAWRLSKTKLNSNRSKS